MLKFVVSLGFATGLMLVHTQASDLDISTYDRRGNFTWTNAFPAGVCAVEATAALTNPTTNEWRPLQNYFTTNQTGLGVFPLSSSNHFFRLLASDVSANTPEGYTNLLNSYGLLHTIAGNGAGGTDGVNYWQPAFEGAFATNVALSRPHIAMADYAGNIFIADKNSHSILKLTTDGRIRTAAGTHVAGNGVDYPTNATKVELNGPNGLWIRDDGTVYILDTGNSKIRRLDTSGMMATLLTETNEPISQGRGIWVKPDESLAYFASGKEMKKWTRSNGVKTLNNNFTELGNFIADANDDIIATDRGANKVYFLDATGGNAGNRNVLFGDGSTNSVVEGSLATTNALYGVRGIWAFPTGGYLLGTDEGSHVLYVDSAGLIHILVNGAPTHVHSGDGQWFHSPGDKVSEVRAITMDSKGNILITENDFGYVTRIDFMRLSP